MISFKWKVTVLFSTHRFELIRSKIHTYKLCEDEKAKDSG